MSYGFTSGEKSLRRKTKKTHWGFIAYWTFMAVLLVATFLVLLPSFTPHPKVTLAPMTNKESCQEIKAGKWTATYQVFEFCQKLKGV